MCDCPACRELNGDIDMMPETFIGKVAEKISLKWLLRLNFMVYGFLGAITVQLLLLVIGM